MATANAGTQALANGANTNTSEGALPAFADLFLGTHENVCEFGDITLVIEDGYHPQLKITISSCVLANTSKVFKVLFRGCFAEGEAIRSGTREVFMDDKPAPMLALCQLLHHKPVQPAIAEFGILDFALLLDKFDCVQALKPATSDILSKLSPPPIYDLVVSAYTLDHPDHFRRYTKALVLQHADISNHSWDDHLPTAFTASITKQQGCFQREFAFCLTSVLDRFTTVAYEALKPNLTYDLMAMLRSNALWPISQRNTPERSIQEHLASFSGLQLPVIHAAKDCGYTTPPPPRLSRSEYEWQLQRHDTWGAAMPPRSPTPPPVPVKKSKPCDQGPTTRTLTELSGLLETLCEGICLECLKTGTAKCGLQHPEPWTAYHEGLRKWQFEEEEDDDSVTEEYVPSELSGSDHGAN